MMISDSGLLFLGHPVSPMHQSDAAFSLTSCLYCLRNKLLHYVQDFVIIYRVV